MDAVIKEMDYVAENFQDKVLDTVYIGGGTPTTLEPEQLDRLITALKSKFDFSTVKEFTVEAGRADSITREKLEVLYRHRVSRISVNPQTMKQLISFFSAFNPVSYNDCHYKKLDYNCRCYCYSILKNIVDKLCSVYILCVNIRTICKVIILEVH